MCVRRRCAAEDHTAALRLRAAAPASATSARTVPAAVPLALAAAVAAAEAAARVALAAAPAAQAVRPHAATVSISGPVACC